MIENSTKGWLIITATTTGIFFKYFIYITELAGGTRGGPLVKDNAV